MPQDNKKYKLVCNGIDHEVARSSVSRTVRIGLIMMSLSLILISGLALFSFNSFKGALEELAEGAIPQIIQDSSAMDKFDGLLSETERLAAASSASTRRIAYKNIQSSSIEIRKSFGGNKTVINVLGNELDILENVLSELNELVAAKILINEQSKAKLSRLFELSEDVIAFEARSHTLQVSAEKRAVITEWVKTAVHMLSQAGNSSSLTTLYKLKMAESKLKKEATALAEISNRIPLEFRGDIHLLERRINQELLGKNGLMELMRARAKVAIESASRGHFAKKIVSNFKATQITLFNQLIDQTAGTTAQLNSRVETMSFVLFVLFISAIFAVVWMVIYFHRNLVLRLINLNAAILERVAGRNASIQDTRNDEITDMTRSFMYYEEEVRRREAELKELAMKDPLTGLSNRRHFMEKVANEIERSSRYGHDIGFLMLDIDFFKEINDTYGHYVGDIVLKDIAQLLIKTLRQVDVVGRLGGEEFAVLLPETDYEKTLILAERVRDEVQQSVWDVDESRIECTVSIGVSYCTGGSRSSEELIKEADKALYIAKEEGRNQVRTFTDRRHPD